ncbi:hypothetical protein Tco_0942452 [Tanacetum coccineum]
METKDTLSSCSNSEEQQMQQIQDKAKKSCMECFRQIHSHLQLLSNNDLKGTRTESGFKRAFATLFGQDVETFTGTMFLNMDQLEKQLDNEECQEIGSMTAFKVLETQFQMFINSRIYLDDEYVDTSSRLGNDAHADDADIKPIYDEEPMAEVDQNAEQSLKEGKHGQFSKLKSNEAKIKHDIDVIETINIKLEHKVARLLKENKTLKRHYKGLYDSIKTTRARNIEHTTSLIVKNDDFKAQLQEKGFAIAALKNMLRKLTGNGVNTKFAKSSILGKPVLQPHRNQSVVRQSTAFKFERPRISNPRFASQVDVNNDLSKPVTTHYLPKKRESIVVKPHHVIVSSESRNSSKNMLRFSSNDTVHNHYLEEAKKRHKKAVGIQDLV